MRTVNGKVRRRHDASRVGVHERILAVESHHGPPHAACERFGAMDVEFVKRPDDGNMKGLAFIKDPDGYWIEILSSRGLSDLILGAD